jgi:hypothetical protein
MSNAILACSRYWILAASYLVIWSFNDVTLAADSIHQVYYDEAQKIEEHAT